MDHLQSPAALANPSVHRVIGTGNLGALGIIYNDRIKWGNLVPDLEESQRLHFLPIARDESNRYRRHVMDWDFRVESLGFNEREDRISRLDLTDLPLGNNFYVCDFSRTEGGRELDFGGGGKTAVMHNGPAQD